MLNFISSWKNRNTIFYLKKRKHEFLIKWYQKTKAYVERLGGEVLKFVTEYKIDERNSKDQYIRDLIKKIQYNIKNQEEFQENNIRKYFIYNDCYVSKTYGG